MSKSDEKLELLQVRLEHLANYEAAFKREIADIRREIGILKAAAAQTRPEATQPTPQKQSPKLPPKPVAEPRPAPRPTAAPSDVIPVGFEQAGIEKFVGTYLISIIGILVTIIGVGIGAKFAIDNDLISPFMRIVFGYAVGIGLTGFAASLREKYPSFSAVLLSGGMAIMYFITFFAYSYYSLVSQATAFLLMVIFTVFTVVSAIYQDRQIIAHIGLVGAYAVPFFLSDDSGRASVLFSYIAIINIGILAVSVRKYWIPLFFTSFAFTWLIYTGWFLSEYERTEHFSIALAATTAFFLIFYVSFLIYKLIRKLPLELSNVSLILVNSFVYYGLAYSLLSDNEYRSWRGLFTILVACLHFAVAVIVSRFKLGDKSSFYLAVVLVLAFLTIAVPVQFDGNVITVLWIAEAVFLFVIGRTKKIPIFEYASLPLMAFASVSLWNDWDSNGGFNLTNDSAVLPFYNKDFLTSALAASGFGIICLVNRIKLYKTAQNEPVYMALTALAPAAFLIAAYNTFRIEIAHYFDHQAFQLGKADTPSKRYIEDSLPYFSSIWQLNYTLLFLSVLSFVNIRKLKSTALGFSNLVLNLFAGLATLSAGLFTLGVLREIYLDPQLALETGPGFYYIAIRYIVFAFFGVLIAACYRYTKSAFIKDQVPGPALGIAFDLGLAFCGLVLLSNELINWTDIYNIAESNKFGLSVLWGLYSVLLIVIGIVYRIQHLRLFAIALLGVTVIKLFFYDMAELETIPKTAAFVTVGFLLLIASFLYNKYTKQIFGE